MHLFIAGLNASMHTCITFCYTVSMQSYVTQAVKQCSEVVWHESLPKCALKKLMNVL